MWVFSSIPIVYAGLQMLRRVFSLKVRYRCSTPSYGEPWVTDAAPVDVSSNVMVQCRCGVASLPWMIDATLGHFRRK
ncbi:hypothetical protein CEXT_579331 [Caerostris extrusa]|uniref:Secreted protein n=1 Tax=Caerostris extrusa TaxID=172846 RepID=A0AAV4XBC0_CAEEX|nr:hypothetical protein CEXT_579331 [Caerostris extrusa]